MLHGAGRTRSNCITLSRRDDKQPIRDWLSPSSPPAPAGHVGFAAVYLSVSICRICVVRSPHRAAAVRPPRDERLLGRRHCAAPLLANEARLVARLGEDEFGCEGALHRGVAPQDKGRAHRGKGAALRFDLVWWQVVEPVGSRENTRADFGLGPVPSLPRRRCLGPPPGRGKHPSAIGGNARWRASERFQDALFSACHRSTRERATCCDALQNQ